MEEREKVEVPFGEEDLSFYSSPAFMTFSRFFPER
jgi:hypothetical protein